MRGNLILKLSSCKAICTFFVLLAVLRRVTTCPLLCQCDILGGEKYVQCDKVNRTILPSEIPSDTELLFLSSTKITKLTENHFARLSNLKTIELSNNQIENITNGVFNGLPKLKTLNLANNRIRRVSSSAFAGLTTLTKLSLSNNHLLSLPQNLIKDLNNLEILNLDKNYLQTIPRGFLNNTLNLKRLNLNSNNLTRVDLHLLQRLRKLNHLDLSNNQITEIAELAFRAPGAQLNFLSLGDNKLSSFPGALFDLKAPFGFLNLLLQDNSMTTIPIEAKTIFDKIKFGKIRLSGNPYVCDSSLRWLQKWTNGSKIAIDGKDITCTTLGVEIKLSEYDFDKTASKLTGTTTMTAPTTSAPTTSSTSTSAPRISTALKSTHTMSPPTSITAPTPVSMPGIDQGTNGTVPTTHAPTATQTQTGSLTTLATRQTTMTSRNTEVIPTTSEVVTINNDNVSSTQLIPGKVNTNVMLRKEHIILATCLSAVFIAIVVFLAMYCFRKKIIKREKLMCTRYDRVRVV